MTRDSVRERGASPSDRGLPLDPATLVILLIIAATLLRAAIGGLFVPLSGFRIDVGDFNAWAQRLAANGPGQFYQPGYFSDYPPGYMYVLWLLGSIGEWLRPVVGLTITPGLVKVPGILADAGVAWLLFLYARRFGGRWLGELPGRWRGETIGVVAAAIYLFNPGTIFNASVWGQIDSVGTLVLLGTLYALARGWTEAAAVGAVVALLVKYQYGFLLPLVAVVGLKRHLFGASSDPAHDGRGDPLRVLTSLAAGLGTLVAMILPFGLAVWAPADKAHSLIDRFAAAAGTYKGLTVNAFNLWRNPWSGLANSLHWGCDSAPPVCPEGEGVAFLLGSFPVSWQLVGAVLFGIAALIALWLVARRDDAEGLLVGTLVLAVAFFALPTRVHERYLFPALALGALLVLRGRPWAWLYAALSVSFFANVYWVYTADWSFAGGVTNPGINGLAMQRDPFLAAVVYSDTGIYLLSAGIVVVLAWLLARSVGMAVRAGEVILAPRPMAPAAAGAWVGTAEVEAAAPPPPLEPVMPVAAGRSPMARVRGWLARDPHDPYAGEPPRRLDRLDVLLLLGLVLAAFVFRLWRLDFPRHFHFDEVYHARTAAEMLANWQEGWDRDSYEWTHPPLAKYLIAAGMVAADPNKLLGGTALEAPASAMAVVPQRSAEGRVASVVFTATGDQITAREATSGTTVSAWTVAGEVAALAYDPDANRLLVGFAHDGAVSAFDLTAFMGQLGSRGPPPGVAQIQTGLAGVEQIVLPDGQPLSLFRGPDGIVEVERETGLEIARSDLLASSIDFLPAGSGEDAPAARVVAIDPARGGLAVLDSATLQPATAQVGSDGLQTLPATPAGPVMVQVRGKDTQVWVPLLALPANEEHGATTGGLTVFDENLTQIGTVPLPGEPRAIGWQKVANIVYIAGIGQDTGDGEVWAIMPHGNGGTQQVGFAAFDTTTLSGPPTALGFDISDHAEGDDHGLLLVTTAGGDPSVDRVDAGSNAFAWRIGGVVFGSILVGLIYLLAATLFRRRRIAVLAAAFVAVDGMSYVMSRIAMNDIFVATFIVAAYLVFWQVWGGRWQRSAWWALPMVGVLIGLAAASKWVGWYALFGLWILVLARSDFGRFLLVAGVAFIAVVAGVGAPWPFLVVCGLGLALALLLVWRRPVRLSPRDLAALPGIGVVAGGIGLAFALAYNTVEGRSPRSAVELLFAFLARGAQAAWPAWVMLGVSAALLLLRAWRSLRDPESDRRWYLPGELGGLAWPWVGASLLVVPLLVYFLAYVPYLELGHGIAAVSQGPGYGWSLDELHSQMFGYHFGLQAGHPASSPWWSWPLDLKPVWFYSHSFDGRTLAVIYNGGNPILFWAGIPAVLWGGLMAWRRRSLALALVVAAFAFQYLPWTRIERATFHYHYFTAVLFAMVAVAYAVDEGLRSWSYRSLAVAFLVAAAVAGVLVFPMGSALVMPDWYINAARALAPWNYAFQFPSPPQGDRGQLLSADSLKLAIGTVVSVGAAAFALMGRDLLGPLAGRLAAPRGSVATPEGDQHEEEPQGHQPERPEPVEVDVGHELAGEEIGTDPDQDHPEDPPALA